MVNMRSKDAQKSGSPPKGEVGEIDTRAPFQSVKAAVNLFGAVALLSKDKDKPTARKKLSSENVLNKETQLMFAQRELEKYKAQFEMVEKTKAKAFSELQKTKETLNALTDRLKIANETKVAAIEAAETVKKQAKQLEDAKSEGNLGKASQNHELEEATDQYTRTVSHLDIAKQQLTKLRRDVETVLEAKSASLQQATEAKQLMNINMDRVEELSKEIRTMQESAQQIKIASLQAQEQEAKKLVDKEACLQAFKTRKQEADAKMELLRQEYKDVVELVGNPENELAEKCKEIESIQDEMGKAHALAMEKVKLVTAELNEATKKLQEVVSEENLLRNSVSGMKMELEEVKRERIEFEEKEMDRLSLEAENTRKEVEMIHSDVIKLREETEQAKKQLEESKEKLENVLNEVEEARVAEKKIHEEMKSLSEKGKEKNEESENKMINISVDEFEGLKKKMVECEKMAEAKEAEVKAKLEISNETKMIVEKRLEENLKSIEELKEATEAALKSAEMAEAAQTVVEGELKRWRQDA